MLSSRRTIPAAKSIQLVGKAATWSRQACLPDRTVPRTCGVARSPTGGDEFELLQQREAFLQLRLRSALQRVPAAAECFDQADAGKEKILAHGQFGFFVGQHCRLAVTTVVRSTVPA